MKSVEVIIKLDPFNDGIDEDEKDTVKRVADKALIVGTNGRKRISNPKEINTILRTIKEKGSPCKQYLSDEYVALFNGDKVIYCSESGACFLGSVIILKRAGDSVIYLTEDEIDEAYNAFASRIINIIMDGQEFTALELE